MLTEEIKGYVAVICGLMKNEDICDVATEEGYPIADLTWRRQPRDHNM